MSPSMLDDFRDEFVRYRTIGEQAMAQVSEEHLNRALAPETNSIATLVRHVSGNLRSRFTEFLTSDGEKPWRNRDAEFEPRKASRAEIDAPWGQGFSVALEALHGLRDADLGRPITIRGQAMSVHGALARSIAHTAAHVGQIVLLARLQAGESWVSLSIPRGGSSRYNLNPTREKRPT